MAFSELHQLIGHAEVVRAGQVQGVPRMLNTASGDSSIYMGIPQEYTTYLEIDIGYSGAIIHTGYDIVFHILGLYSPAGAEQSKQPRPPGPSAGMLTSQSFICTSHAPSARSAESMARQPPAPSGLPLSTILSIEPRRVRTAVPRQTAPRCATRLWDRSITRNALLVFALSACPTCGPDKQQEALQLCRHY